MTSPTECPAVPTAVAPWRVHLDGSGVNDDRTTVHAAFAATEAQLQAWCESCPVRDPELCIPYMAEQFRHVFIQRLAEQKGMTVEKLLALSDFPLNPQVDLYRLRLGWLLLRELRHASENVRRAAARLMFGGDTLDWLAIDCDLTEAEVQTLRAALARITRRERQERNDDDD